MIMEEVAILNKIDHPNIVKYYETYEDESKAYLVMEYIDGESLQTFLQKRRILSENESARYMQQLF